MTVFAGGSFSKQWPALLDLLEQVGFKPVRFNQYDTDSTTKPKQGASLKKNKTEINKIYYSKSHAPSSMFSKPLKEKDDARALIFYQSAELFIAEGMSASLSPDEVTFIWKRNAEETLSLFKKHRKKIILIESHEALCAPNSFLTLCVNKFRFNGPENIEKTYDPVSPSKLYRLLAQEILKRSPDIQNLQDELYASSVPLVKSRQAVPLAVADLYNEQQLLLAKLEKSTLNALHLELENKSMTEEIRTFKETIGVLEKTINISHEHMTDTQNKAEALFIELQTQKQKTQDYENREVWREAKTNREISKLQNDINKHSKAVDAMKASRSWRLTSPVRKVVRKISAMRTRNPNFKEHVKIIKSSPLFDAEWYKQKYPDVSRQKIGLAEHYVKYGAFEGRSPGPNFNAREYLNQNPDVRSSGENPLVHFLHTQKNPSGTNS